MAYSQENFTEISTDSALKDKTSSLPLSLQKLSSERNISVSVDTTSYIIQPRIFFGFSTLNNYASPINALREDWSISKNFNNGYHTHDFMAIRGDELPLYLSNKTYAELMVSEAVFFVNSQNGLIDNLNVGAFVTKNFAKNIYLNLRYDRINQKGIYLNSRNLLSRLNAQIANWNDSTNWSYELSYVNVYDKIQHSGGVLSDTFLLYDQYQLREAIPVINSQAYSKVNGDEFNYKLRYRFDIKDQFKVALQGGVGYQEYINIFDDQSDHDSINLQYGSTYFNFTDSIESHYYQRIFPFQFLVDVKMSDRWNFFYRINYNNVLLRQNEVFKTSTFSSCNSIGINYKGLNNQEFSLNSHFKSQGQGNGYEYNFLYQINLSRSWVGQVELSHSSMIPAWIFNRFAVNRSLMRSTQLDNVLENELKVGFSSTAKNIPSIGLVFRQQRNLFFLNFDQNLVQESKAIRIFDINVVEDIRFHFIGLYNKLRFINYNPDPAGWSAWYTKHELYLGSKLFKSNIQSRLALVADFIAPRKINGFNPLLGMYYPIRNNTKIFGPITGLLLNVQIADLNATIELVNIDSFWNKKRPVITEYYPWYDFNLRIQLLWKFLN